MITTSAPSPTTFAAASSPTFKPHSHYGEFYNRSISPQISSQHPRRRSLLATTRQSFVPSATPKSVHTTPSPSNPTSALQKAGVKRMLDVGTQHSTPSSPPVESIAAGILQTTLASGNLASHDHISRPFSSESTPASMTSQTTSQATAAFTGKRPISGSPSTQAQIPDEPNPRSTPQAQETPLQHEEAPSSKKARPEAPSVKLLPLQYEFCDTRDLVILIASMLMELIRYNDAIPLREGHLTRFHSRAAPTISVIDYLQRLTTHATLSPPILLSMVYYIDRLCALYPAFTISSLTIHRFLITSATVASKGLSDSFWTNKTYARVGGVSLKELALLELEFLWRVEWRIVPKPEVLVDYYRSLVDRADNYEIDITGQLDGETNSSAVTSSSATSACVTQQAAEPKNTDKG